MNISKEQTGELEATIQISIESEDYQKDVNDELKQYQRKANMPGFRPGKVPMGMIKKMYGKSVMAEKVNRLISDTLNNYIVENKLPVLGYPLANMEKTGTIDFDEKDSFEFYFDIGLSPDFEVDMEKVEKPEYIKAIATDDKVDEAIQNILKNAAKMVDEDVAEEGDTLELKITQVDENGEEMEGGYQKDIQFEIDEIENESEKEFFVGKELGAEFVYNFSKAIPEEETRQEILQLDEENKTLADNDFNVIIDSIKRKKEAELNEELFNEMYPDKEIRTEDEFRAQIKEDIEKQYANDCDRYFLNKAIDAMIDHHQFDMPDAFIKRWLLDNNEGKLTEADVEKDYDNYVKSLRWQLISSKLEKDHEELKVNIEEIRDVVRRHFMGSMQMPPEMADEMKERMDGIVDTILQNKEEAAKIKDQLAEQKLARFFKEKLAPRERDMNYDDFVNLVTGKNDENE